MNPAARQAPVISITSNIGDNNQYSGNVINSNNTELNDCNISVADERPAVLEWLSPLNPWERHHSIGMRLVAGVGDWLLNKNQFIQWHDGGDSAVNPVLFCSGGPGVGKTYLSSLVIDRLCDRRGASNMAVACVYCDFYSQKEQSATGLLGVLLKQVVSALEPIPDEVLSAYVNSKGSVGGRRLQLLDILEMLIKSLSRLQRGFVCIDALDEFPENSQRDLWVCLQRIVRECPNTRLFLTGRPYIGDSVQKYFPGTAEMCTISPTENEIGLYVRERLSKESESDAMDKELAANILRIIPRISGILLLVSLNMDAILAEPTIYLRKRALGRVTKGLSLDGVYSSTLKRIRQQGGSKEKFGVEALMWISLSERPLKSAELCHALGVELGEEFSTQNVLPIQTILGYTLGLVTFDENTSTVRLVHFTLQEYLGKDPTQLVCSHSMMAGICLTYLNCRSLREPWQNLDAQLARAPFLEYATCFWAAHVTRAKQVTGPVEDQALQLLDGYENHVSAAILWRKKIRKWYSTEDVQGITGLHCVAFWGIEEIAIAMLKKKRWDVNGCDSQGHTPLTWAVKYGNDRLVKLFLEQEDIKPDMATQDGQTVLSFAVEWPNEGAVKLLLGHKGVNPNSLDNHGRTPLSLALSRRHEGILELLLEHKDVNPNARNSDGQTPLLLATTKNLESVVKLLLNRRDVNPNASNSDGRTPLLLATTKNLEGVVKLLLKRGDVNPNASDSDGRTPISLAVLEGHGSVLKLLLGRGDVNPNSLDNDGRSPLSHAARSEAERLMDLFLERIGANPDLSDVNHRTPPSYPASFGTGDLANLLLERDDIHPDLPDTNGRTPLSFAASGGNEAVMKLLLQSEDVNPNLPDNNGRTPLSFAAECRYQRVVKLSSEGCGPITAFVPLEDTPEREADLLQASEYVAPCSPDSLQPDTSISLSL